MAYPGNPGERRKEMKSNERKEEKRESLITAC